MLSDAEIFSGSRLLKMYSSSSLIFLGSKLVGEESGVGTQNGEERRNLFS